MENAAHTNAKVVEVQLDKVQAQVTALQADPELADWPLDVNINVDDGSIAVRPWSFEEVRLRLKQIDNPPDHKLPGA